jgi:uncharacterized Zn finger protein
MPDSHVNIQCPHCGHDQARPFIATQSVVTVKCTQCTRTWSIEVAALAPELRQQLTKALKP